MTTRSDRNVKARARAAKLAVTLCAILLAGGLLADDDPERELGEVRERLEELRHELERDVARRDELSTRLRNAELLLAS